MLDLIFLDFLKFKKIEPPFIKNPEQFLSLKNDQNVSFYSDKLPSCQKKKKKIYFETSI